MTVRRLCGRKPKLTPEQVQEVQAWRAAWHALPTRRQLAARLDIPEGTLAGYLANPYRKNHQRSA
jgi:hypothetical protein